ncbi:rho GDP-dissociation inhibitor 1-like [Anneissia japonica]|uniref:rho GDP-dissociation inhibitor 1-like n=1 Tax=Anneissia japonica TaxID=1529436 RepID=UPI001425B9F2|nr:rho GDP-dissociation inhibitor 1-like [Anneissia japonica]
MNPDGPNVVVEKMAILSEGRVIKEFDLTGDLSKLKDTPVVLKEGVEFQVQVIFRVNLEIVSGLRYHQSDSRKGIVVDKSSFMIGSYGPKIEPYQYLTPTTEAPKGMIARGHYIAKSSVLDDDRNRCLEWEWSFDIKKDWE